MKTPYTSCCSQFSNVPGNVPPVTGLVQGNKNCGIQISDLISKASDFCWVSVSDKSPTLVPVLDTFVFYLVSTAFKDLSHFYSWKCT